MVRNRVGYSEYLDSKAKRAFDLAVFAAILIPALLVMAVSGLVTLLIEGRPVFFFQRRLGRKGLLFWIPKIRTMYPHANPYRPSPKPENSDLITPTGRFMRRHRLDELPQVFSVLAGRMSLVGPRPEIPAAASEYSRVQRKRLLTKPGMTGLWQVLADREIPICSNIKYDLYYLRRASLLLDIRILFLTLLFVISPKRKPRTYENRIYSYKLSVSN